MKDQLIEKLFTIESKLSSIDKKDIKSVTFINALESTKSIDRHSILQRENTKDILPELIVEMENLSKVMAAFDKLYTSFYNNKEIQLVSIQNRFQDLKLKQKILNNVDQGITKTILNLNDKKMFSPGIDYEITNKGIGFPLIEEEKIIPSQILLSRDSNVKIGTLLDQKVNSLVSAISSIDQNDLFSIHRADTNKLRFIFTCKFSKENIINEITFAHIVKAKQTVKIRITDTKTNNVVYEGEVTDEELKFRKPILTKELVIEIESNPIVVNQLDIKELSFYKRKYKNSGQIKTIPMPVFSNKYLTLEDVTFASPEEKKLVNLIVNINGEKLNSLVSEEKVLGPYKDPLFDIAFETINESKLLSYLAEPLYKATSSLPEEGDYRTFFVHGTEKSINLVKESEASNNIFVPLNLPGFESFLNVSVEGIQYQRISEVGTLDSFSNKYKAIYTGIGYNLLFNSLPLGAKVKCTINSAPSYMKNNKIIIPSLGLGTEAKIEYCKDIGSKKIPIILINSNYLDLRCKNIQAIYFETANGEELTTLVEKPLGSTLASNEYSVDYLNGLVYLGNNISGFVGVNYFITDFFSQNIEKEDRSIHIPRDIKIFEFGSKISQLENKINNPKTIYGFQKHNGLNGKIMPSLGVIQIPKFITIQKGSVQIYDNTFSKKEVDFVDGKTELLKAETKQSYFDYISSQENYYTYRLRDPAKTGALITAENDQIIRKRNITIEELNYFVPGEYPLGYGDYILSEVDEGGSDPVVYMHLRNLNFPEKPDVSISVKIVENINEDLFSVNYETNQIFIGQESTLFTGGNINFKYAAIDLNMFTLASEIAKKENVETNEYNVYIYNKEEIRSMLPYFTPTIESISIGFIG